MSGAQSLFGCDLHRDTGHVSLVGRADVVCLRLPRRQVVSDGRYNEYRYGKEARVIDQPYGFASVQPAGMGFPV